MLTVVPKSFIVGLMVFYAFKDIPCNVKTKLIDSYCLDACERIPAMELKQT